MRTALVNLLFAGLICISCIPQHSTGLGSGSELGSKAEYCKVSQKHTGCAYRAINKKKCKKVVKRGFASAQKKLMLHLHNKFRSFIAHGLYNDRKAANMVELAWDDELASLAQLWADQCTPSVDISRDTVHGHRRTAVGQSYSVKIYGSGKSKMSVRSIFNEFMGNVFSLTPGQVMSYKFDEDTARYTQIAWATTTHIGCGYTKAKKGKKYKHYVVCNYAPSGNNEGYAIYTIGKPCSMCPPGYGKCYRDSLCSK